MYVCMVRLHEDFATAIDFSRNCFDWKALFSEVPLDRGEPNILNPSCIYMRYILDNYILSLNLKNIYFITTYNLHVYK